MIKFFRKIRYDLMKQSKSTKYFKYALGEIILVVIGILIALQINNWNEQRKYNKQELYTLKQLQVEFKADSLKLSSILKITEGKTNALKKMIRLITEQKSDSLQLPMIFFSGKFIPFYNYSPTYNELVSSGNLNLISNDSIKNAINDFINQNDMIDKSIYQDMQQKKTLYMNQVFKYFNGDINGQLWNRKLSIKELEALGADYKGFVNDPLIKYNLNKVLAADSEFHFITKKNLSNKLNLVLKLLHQELAKYD